MDFLVSSNLSLYRIWVLVLTDSTESRWLVVAYAIGLIGSFFLVPESIYNRQIQQIPTVTDKTEDPEKYDIASLGGSQLPAKTYLSSLKIYNGTKTSTNLLLILLRPFYHITSPSVILGCIVFSVSFNWLPLAASTYGRLRQFQSSNVRTCLTESSYSSPDLHERAVLLLDQRSRTYRRHPSSHRNDHRHFRVWAIFRLVRQAGCKAKQRRVRGRVPPHPPGSFCSIRRYWSLWLGHRCGPVNGLASHLCGKWQRSVLHCRYLTQFLIVHRNPARRYLRRDYRYRWLCQRVCR